MKTNKKFDFMPLKASIMTEVKGGNSEGTTTHNCRSTTKVVFLNVVHDVEKRGDWYPSC